jgi:hypothetical protein
LGDGVRDRGDQGGVDERGSDAEYDGGRGGQRDGAVRGGEQAERRGLEQHAGDDQRFAAGAVGPLPGQDLPGPPNRGVEPGDEPDLGSRGVVCGEEERDEAPGEGVVEVVDEPGLRAGSK